MFFIKAIKTERLNILILLRYFYLRNTFQQSNLFNIRQAQIVKFFQVFFKFTEKVVKCQLIIISAYIKQMIPPTGISVFIPDLILKIPICKQTKIFKLIFTGANVKCMLHTEIIITQRNQRSFSQKHTRAFFHFSKKTKFIKSVFTVHIFHLCTLNF